MFLHYVSSTYTPDLMNLLRGLLSGDISNLNALMQATMRYAFDGITFYSSVEDFDPSQTLEVR